MATLNTTNIKHASSSTNNIVLNADGSTTIPNLSVGPNRNLIINGAMQLAQRGTSAAGTGYKTIDRFTSGGSGSHAVTQSQDTDVPTGQGFSKSLKFDCTTANASPNAGDYLTITYKIEAQDLQQIANGTSSAKKLTLSFWVKSPKTGTHAVGLYKDDNTGRQNTKTYSVSAADTWEKKTITFDGDTSGGGIANDNGLGMQLNWHLLAGSNFTSVDSTSWVNYSDAAWAYGHAVNVLDNTANNFYITGVQLEVGSIATDYEFKSFAQELTLCQRYYQKSFEQGTTPAHGVSKGIYQYIKPYTSDYMAGLCHYLPVEMRSTPTVVTYTLSGVTNSTDNRFNHYNNSSWGVCALSLEGNSNPRTLAFGGQTGSSSTVLIQYNFTASAEL